MKKSLSLVIIIICLMALIGCANKKDSSDKSGERSQSMYSDLTKLHYQELNGYKAAVIDRDFITVPRVLIWLDEEKKDQRYHKYIHSDPDSWEMFISWPAGNITNKPVPKPDSMYFYLSDQVVHLCFDSTSNTEPTDLLLLIQAPSRGVWPSDVIIYVDGLEIYQT